MKVDILECLYLLFYVPILCVWAIFSMCVDCVKDKQFKSKLDSEKE